MTVTYHSPTWLPVDGGTDSITATVGISDPHTATTSYTYGTLVDLEWSKDPIAPDGTLARGETVTFYVVPRDQFGNAMRDLLDLELISHANIGTFDLGSGRQDAEGREWATYHAGASLPLVHVSDTLQARVGSFWTSTSYSYLGVGSLTWNAVPISPTGMLGAGDTVPLSVVVRDTAGHFMPGVHVNLDKGTPAGVFDSGACGDRCQADDSGTVWVTYHAASVLPTWTTTDTITASVGLSAMHASSTSYTYGTPATLAWSSDPIAPTGTLGPGTTTALTVTVRDAAGAPLPWTPLYIVPEATIGTFDLSACPGGSCMADANGQASVTYHTPATLPISGGADMIRASAWEATSATSYTYAPLGSLEWSSVPIAATGALAAGATKSLTITAKDTLGHPMPTVAIHVDTTGTTIGSVDLPAGCVAGSCTTDATGKVSLTYHAPATTLPVGGGTDTIGASAGTVSSSTTYTYATLGSLVWHDVPIAATGSLDASTTRAVTLSALDTAGHPMPSVVIHVDTTGTTVGSVDLPAGCVAGACTTDASGEISMTYHTPASLPAGGGTDTIGASAGTVSSSTTYTYGKFTVLTYTGATVGDHGDPVTLAAGLVEQVGSAPVAGRTVTFVLAGTETCSAVTDASGTASCTVTPMESAGSYSVVATFAGDGVALGSSTSATFVVERDETSLAFGAIPAFVATGSPVTLTATLTDPADAAEGQVTASPIGGKPVVLGIGTGAIAQVCTAITTSSGVASCTIAAVAQPLGPVPVSATFTADAYHQGASRTGSMTVYTSAGGGGSAGGGAFVIGDRSAIVGATVTLWSATWANANSLSGGAAPAAFKGFATTLSSTPPVAGGTWSSFTGSSASPPDTVPAYVAVVVTSRVTLSGAKSQLTAAGPITRVAIVAVNPGYDPAAKSRSRTGRVLGFLP